MISKTLKLLQMQKNETQKQTAQQLNINYQTYNGYLTGKMEPNIETLIKLANYFNVSVDYLIGNEQKNTIYCFNELEKTAVNILLSLPENYFYEFLGRLKTTADLLKINY